MNNPLQASPFYDYSAPLIDPMSTQYANQQAPSQATRVSGRESFSGAARPAARVAATPYARPAEHLGPSSSVKASSTTSEFTKRKNWSQHIIDEIQDFMHVLSPTGNVMFSTPSIRDLTGWTSEEVTGRPIADFIHTDDVAGFIRDFESSLRDGHDLTLYYRFRMKDDRYTIFEITGHPYYAEENGQQQCKCFFAMGRPYPSKNTAMLDSFLELKTENERLRQELQVMYGEMEGTGPAIDYRPGASGTSNDYAQPRQSNAAYGQFDPSQSPYDQSQHPDNSPGPIHGSNQVQAPLHMSVSYGGAQGSSSAANVKPETAAEKKKKKVRVEEGEFVCRDCGTVESPEWRKGPDGPKSLCNACGLRFAKLKSKGDKLAKVLPKK